MPRLGTDIVYIPRMRLDEAFVGKILSSKEREIYDRRKDKKEFLAGRFAAKEAFMKAMKKGLGLAPLDQIEILYLEDGSPTLIYEGKRYEVSIAHDGDYAIATVII